MKIVSNTTPIISLASIGRLDILKDIFKNILIPESVYREIKAKKGCGYAEVDADFIQSLRDFLFLKPQRTQRFGLGQTAQRWCESGSDPDINSKRV